MGDFIRFILLQCMRTCFCCNVFAMYFMRCICSTPTLVVQYHKQTNVASDGCRNVQEQANEQQAEMVTGRE
jgi:hypothetical protein